MVSGISLGKSFWVVNTWQAPVQKWLKGLTLNFAPTFLTLTDCCKTVPTFFLIMSDSFFLAITLQALKAYFAWKQLRVDYSKNTWKEENHGHSFLCLLVGYILVIFFENWSSVGAGAQIIGKVDSFSHNFGPNFTNIWRVEKRSIILKKVALSTFKETW